jgi:hypothetical protein
MPESAIESLRSLLHLPVGAGDPLADLLRFSGTDPELTRRLLLATAVAAALSLVFWFLDRTSDIWLGWIPGRRRRRVWEAELKRRGLGPEERGRPRWRKWRSFFAPGSPSRARSAAPRAGSMRTRAGCAPSIRCVAA